MPGHKLIKGAFQIILIGMISSMAGCLPVYGGGQKPKAAFTMNTFAGKAPLNVRFMDLSTPGASPITAWMWVFGDIDHGFDADTSTSPSPSHVYAKEGSYIVSLTVTNAYGKNTAYKRVKVSAGPLLQASNK